MRKIKKLNSRNRKGKNSKKGQEKETVAKGLRRVAASFMRPQCDKPINKVLEIAGVRQAAWRCRKSLPCDNEKRNAVLGEIYRLEKISPNKKIAKPPKEKLANDIINLAKFKHCKDFEKVDRIASGI